MKPRPKRIAVPAGDLFPRPSDACSFHDVVWRLGDPPSGQKPHHGTFNWNVKIDTRSSLLDERHASLLYGFRIWLWTMIHDPRGAKATSPGGATELQRSVESMLRWMASEGMTDFSGVDNAASWRFLAHFLDTHEDVDIGRKHRPRAITYASALSRLRLPMLLFRQRRAMARFGVAHPNEPPYDGRRLEDLVIKDLDLPRQQKLEPISDEVVLSLLNAAHRWLGTLSDDVIALQDACFRDVDPSDGLDFYRRAREAMEAFQFSSAEDSISLPALTSSYERTLADGRTGIIVGRQVLRRLILTVQAAAIACIQGCTGMRASEITALEDDNGEHVLPSCISSRVSADGLLELFYCRSVELKVNKERTEWLVASRLVGSEYLPPPLRAFGVLHRLFARWRALGNSRRLIVTFSAARGLPRFTDSIGSASTQHLTDIQKDFLREQCDTSKFSSLDVERFCQNDALRGQLWRTTYATFLYRVDARLLEPISRHFKHLRIAMTETKYVGNDVSLLESLESARVQHTARFFRDAIENKEPLVGKFGRVLRDFPIVTKGSDLAHYELAVVENGLHIVDLEYGSCAVALAPEKSRCNVIGHSAAWHKSSPNEAVRNTEVCVGCPLFAASRGHLPYWRERLSRLEKMRAEELRVPSIASHVVSRRLAVAQSMVHALSKPSSSL